MQNLNPIEKAKYIENNFIKYISSTYDFESETYGEQFRKELCSTKLLKGPYVSKNLEFESAKTINQLIEEGVVHKDFRLLGDTDCERKLRTHQEKAIRLVHQGHSLIVTTGTGSGKTESFLYPIINEILQEDDIDTPGVRAIFLFPMNALVNDQFDRIREMLNCYPQIKYAYFTGNTKNRENDKDGIKESIRSSTDHAVGDNELLDREQIRENPPHILFTNYSMLEYILLRPKDDSILSGNYTDKWKFIVLDEAHTYKGALGIEIGMLLRRLQQRIGHDVQFILSSATLGEQTEEGIKKIQEFGYKLTSKRYGKEDILFSDRIKLDVSNIKFQVKPSEYVALYSKYDMETIDDFLTKYNVKSTELAIDGKLYDLIIHDKNIYALDSILTKSMSLEDLAEEMRKVGFSSIEELSAFIELVCKCKKNNLKIMDLKYHSFIRSVAGAFVTLGNNPQMSLKQREYINGKKAFEIGSCSKCNSMYLIGVEKNGHLYQNHSVDIYENYNEDEEIILDYFILEDEIKNQDVDFTKLRKYTLCSKCGRLVDDSNANKSLLACEHDDVEKVVVYKIDKGDSSVRNNLTDCPICNGKSKKGLVHTVSMGKESATALITQIFFEAIDQKDDKPQASSKPFNKLFIRKPIENNNIKPYIKQILSFSDSRQQASFAVKFAENNHHRLLRKRLIYEILKDEEDMLFDRAEAKLDSIIDKHDLFDTGIEVSSTKQAKITLLDEVLNIDGIYGGEGLGLFYFDYEPINTLVEELSDEEVCKFLSSVNIKTKIGCVEFGNYLQFFINNLRTVPAVNYDGLTREDRENYFSYRMFDNNVRLKKNGKLSDSKGRDISKSIHGIISNTNRSNRIELYTQKIFGINKEDADKLLEAVWEVLSDSENKVLTCVDNENQLYRIEANRFQLHKYTQSKWYVCKKCRKITRFNNYGVCPHCFEERVLSECNPDQYFQNNYYRQQYVNKKIEKLVYKEHTAQLDTKKAKGRQIDFKNKKINYLSCSTTFEMGINIGSLENVLLRNVPPSPANYIQRAGRAGRAQDSSAFVLTYCSPTSHDYTFFENPLRMVDGICNAPIFTMGNTKIICRHLLAVALSKFFRDNKSAFEDVKAFYLDGGYEKFINYIKEKPVDLIEDTDKVLSTTEAKGLMHGHWIDRVLSDDEINISLSKENIESAIDEFTIKKNEAIANNDDIAIAYFARQINNIHKDRDLIRKLADGNLVPKYGFPTDLVEIKVKDLEELKNNYDLTRDMQIALSEYVPDSEIMVDKKTIVSRYINKPKELLHTYYYECPNCHKTVLKFSQSDAFKCPECKADLQQSDGSFVTPRYGFTGEIKRNTATELKPKRSYSSPVKYIGNGALYGEVVKVNDYLQFYTTKDDELLIINENPFFTCDECGYTIIDKEHAYLPYIDKEHKGIYSNCSNRQLNKQGLGFAYKTDVLKMVVSMPFDKGYNQALSVLYALLEGISFAFDIERNDIDGIYINEDNNQVFVLFDTVPGGAGHVKRLLDKGEMLKAFEYALDKVSQNCCDTACYNCLKNYKNQKYHEFLRRNDAKEFLEELIKTFKAQH
ncbi:MAG: DEAD/DEAH box helicase [Clostridia bacterium]|nr:DEAD/DEAH box helicase [Clostridia bacterium]